jgi:hypothetical protein
LLAVAVRGRQLTRKDSCFHRVGATHLIKERVEAHTCVVEGVGDRLLGDHEILHVLFYTCHDLGIQLVALGV